MLTRLTLTLLGAPQIQLDDVPISIGRNKALGLLAYLAVSQQPVTRDHLTLVFWSDYGAKEANTQLRQILWAIHKAIGKEWLQVGPERVSVNFAANLWVDVNEYRRGQEIFASCNRANHLATLITLAELYRGDFLSGFTLADSPDFAHWQQQEAEALRQAQAGLLAHIVTQLAAQQEPAKAISFARRWLTLEPANETAHCHLMQLYYASGQRGLALRQYQECVQTLRQELDAPPAATTVALYQVTVQDQGVPSPSGVSALHTMIEPKPAPPEQGHNGQKSASTFDLFEPFEHAHRALAPVKAPALPKPEPPPVLASPPLPTPLTPFIGGEPELVQIEARLRDPACRLLTLVGPGGIGKTRLALAAAQQLIDHNVESEGFNVTSHNLNSQLSNRHFPDGIYFVPLADLTTPDRLATSIANALHFTLYRREEEPFQQLLHYLADKRLLLLLDNFEHLLAAAPQVSTLLAQAPALKVLATSRERLNIQGEWLLDVPGLGYPQGVQSAPAAADVAHYSALQLFVESARRVNASFVVDGENVGVVARICQLVEGMPLALELAASWLRLLSCTEIAAELEQSLTILSVAQRDLPERHRSIHALFAYSWSLLSAAEQETMRRLAVFRGGFRREAAQAVAGAALLLLMALADKSLLRRDGVGRFRMHELLRQFATEQLAQHPEEVATVYRQHANYFIPWLQKQGVHLHGKTQKSLLAAISAEIENIRIAWQYRLQQTDLSAVTATQAPLALDTLADVYELYGWYHEGAALFADALTQLQARSSPQTRHIEGKLMARLGFFWQRLGQYAKAKQLLQEGYNLLQATGATGETIYCLNSLSEIARVEGDYAEAQRALAASIDLCRAENVQPLLGRALNLLGILQGAQGHYTDAQQLFHESLAIYEALEDQQGIARSYNNLGILAYFAQDYPAARRFYQGSLAINRELGHQYDAAMALSNLGLVAQKQGHPQDAIELFQEALALERKIGYEMGMGLTLNDLSAIFLELGRVAECETYLREVFRLAQKIHSTPLCLAGLAVLAHLQAHKGAWPTCARLAALAQRHPASEEETRNKVSGLLAQAQLHLTPDELTQLTAVDPAEALPSLLVELAELW